jgi:hypothetical protein
MTKPMAMEFTFIKMEPDTKVSGKTIFNMALVRKYGLITQNTKVIMLKAKNMERDSTSGKTVACMMEIGMKIE